MARRDPTDVRNKAAAPTAVTRSAGATSRIGLSGALSIALVLAAAALLATLDRAGTDALERGRAFFYLFARNERSAALLGILLLGIVASPLGRILGNRAYAWALATGRHPRSFAAVATILLACSAAFAYQRFPIALDEWMPQVQARIFSTGTLFGKYPPELLLRLIPYGFIDFFYLVNPFTGAFISAYWPGHALLLIPFVAAGTPWLLNPLLGGLSLLLTAAVCKQLTPRRATLGLCLLFFLGSASFVANASSFYSMTAHLATNLGFVLLVLVPTPRRLVAAGLVGSFALVLHQPLFHPLVALPWLLRFVLQRRWRELGWLALGYAPLTLVVGGGWLLLRQAMSASWSEFARQAGLPQVRGMASTFGDGNALLGMFKGLASLLALPRGEALAIEIRSQLELWTWAVPGLPLLAAVGAWLERRTSDVRCVAWSFATTWLAFFWIGLEQGHGWGYRYLDAAWWALPLLAALALGTLRLRPWRRRAAALAVLSIAMLGPYRMAQIHGFVDEMQQQAAQLTPERPTIYFLDTRVGFYRKDLVRNDPFLRGNLVTLVAADAASDADLAASLLDDPQLLARVGPDSIWAGSAWRGSLAAPPRSDSTGSR